MDSIPTSMRAAVVTKFGDATVISLKDDHPVPNISKPSQVLVRMHATSVNPGDCMIRAGKARLLGKIRPPYIPGLDGAGVVARVGEKVTKFKVGDEVYGCSHFDNCGCSAQYCIWDESELAMKPKNLTFSQAASLPVVALTGYIGITQKGEMKPGERILVIGGAGGVGSFSVQYAKAMGGHVIAVCSTRNIEFVKSLGADQVIDYTTQKFKDVLSKEEDKVDIVFDTVGDRNCEYQAFQVLKSKGRYIAAAIVAGFIRISQPYKMFMALPNGEDLQKITKLVEEGKIVANEIKEMPLEALPEAHDIVSKKKGKGKVVCYIDNKK